VKIARPSRHLPADRPWLGVNFWSRLGGPFMWRTYDDALVREELTTLADHGMFLTRSFLFWPDFHPAPDTIDESFTDRYRRFLRLHEELGMRTIPTFLVGHMSGQNFDVAWRGGRDLFHDAFMLGQQAFFIREMTRRLADSPAIAGWLISNEIPQVVGRVDRAAARAWGLICVNAVRAGGSSAPVSLGDGSWGQDVTGVDNGFRLADQHDMVDFTGPHVYPASNDKERQFAAAAVNCELSVAGKPVILEEFGASSALAADDHIAVYYRQVLHLSLLAGATGWLAWNNTDFDLPAQPPYSHHLHELGFGVTTASGQPKPALHELHRFSELLGRLDLAACRRAETGTAILVPSYLGTDHPFVEEDDRQIIPPILTQAYLAAKHAGLAPAVVREEDGVPHTALTLVPSVKALTGPTFTALRERARGGAHVYLSWFSGGGPRSAGSWWPPLEPSFGVRHRLWFGVPDHAATELTLTVGKPFGTLAAGDQLKVIPAGANTAYLPLEITDDAVDVLLTDQDGQPALVRRRVGDGALYLSAYPIEYYASQRADANLDDQAHLIYQALAAEAGATPDISSGNPHVITDSLLRDDGARFVWLINTSGEPQSSLLFMPHDTTLRDVERGEVITPSTQLEPFGVLVGRCEPPDGRE
jgi:endo-1,4-beta-mannosidase